MRFLPWLGVLFEKCKSNLLLVVLLFFFAVLVVAVLVLGLSLFVDEAVMMVNWETIGTIVGLLVVTTGMKLSNYFYLVGERVLRRVRTPRNLVFVLTLFTVVLSAFVTNDVALFVVVPLTISMCELAGEDLGGKMVKLVVFETIAANVGSSLTPIGNPQNIFVWHKSGVSFLGFLTVMAPFEIALLSLLLLYEFLVFRGHNREIGCKVSSVGELKLDRRLFVGSVAVFVAFLAFCDLDMVLVAVVLVVAVYAVFFRGTFRRVDWMLIAIFVLMFIDTGLGVKVFNALLPGLVYSLNDPVFLFVTSILLSQVISNVPATIFLSQFTGNWRTLLYGVNVGGNGTLIASLANVISFRLIIDKRGFIKDFHKHSLIYLLVSAAALSLFILR